MARAPPETTRPNYGAPARHNTETGQVSNATGRRYLVPEALIWAHLSLLVGGCQAESTGCSFLASADQAALEVTRRLGGARFRRSPARHATRALHASPTAWRSR